jgi:hypothetical protein
VYGFEATRRIMETPPFPIIICSAAKDPTPGEAFQLGCATHVLPADGTVATLDMLVNHVQFPGGIAS